MNRKHRPQQAPAPELPAISAQAEAEPGVPAGPAVAAPAGDVAAAGGASSEPQPEHGGDALRRLEQEATDWKERCLRAAAELDNFKKRAARERTETWARAQADLIARTLDALDDLGRIAALDPTQTTSQALHEGAGLVERKLQKALEGVGLERVDPAGQPFDPNLHEAVMTMPASSPEAHHTVGSVFQPGYRLNGTLVRPARVAVLTWTEPAGEAVN